MGKQDELPVLAKVYDLLLWALPVVGKIPRSHRYTLGESTETSLLKILELLIRAKFARDKAPHLEEANLQLDLARYEVRLMHDLRFISGEQYGKFCEGMLEVGKQVGGWKKAGPR